MNFRSDFIVQEIGQWGTDLDIAEAAWASSGNSSQSEKRIKGLLNSLFRDRHGSPIDEGFLSVYVEAPRAVRDEWFRHRNLSYSSSSLRYQLDGGDVYVPPPHRPLKKAEGFKQIRPIYEPLSTEEYLGYKRNLLSGYVQSALSNNEIIGIVDSTEGARWLTHDGSYTQFRARGMLRPWLQFLQLRTHNESANHPSWPMWEIDQCAQQVEDIIAARWPLTYEAWNKNGRDI